MIRVKVCGVTRLEDALHAASVGADFLGFVFAPSPRRITPSQAGEISRRIAESHPDVGRVGVFVDPGEEELAATAVRAHLTHLQIHGRPPASLPDGIPWIAVVGLALPAEAALPPGDPWAVLVEPEVAGGSGGTGRRFAWEWAAPLNGLCRLFIAGGLDAQAVPLLLGRLTPYGIDASSRLESSPGIKDREKVRAFVAAVRRHDPAGREER